MYKRRICLIFFTTHIFCYNLSIHQLLATLKNIISILISTVRDDFLDCRLLYSYGFNQFQRNKSYLVQSTIKVRAVV